VKKKGKNMDIKEMIAKAISSTKNNKIIQIINTPLLKHVKKEKVPELETVFLDIHENDGVKEVDFTKKSKRVYSTELRENLLDWNNRDFALYIKNKIESKFRPNWGLKFMGVVTNLDKMKDKVQNYLGFCDNIAFKDFIDYYFKTYAAIHQNKNENKMIILKYMSYESVMESFVSSYDYNSSLKKLSKEKNTIVKIDNELQLSMKKIDMSYLLGLNNFLLEYGIILVANWLSIEKKLDKEYITNAIEKCISRMNKISIKKIVDVTRSLSPYPDWFEIKTFPNFEFDIIFEKTNKWDFIQEKKENGSV
jgi:hypothetical protein